MPRFKLFGLLCLLLACLTLALSPSPAMAADCVSSYNSQMYYAPGYDFYCAAGNGACTQCVFSWGGGSYTICTTDSASGYMICFDYQGL
ncbi:MAG TPA: hypothetical protein VHR45_03810 [Thermoanaerobaculia bacterium]|nr:hypothetical protein [Thermoanaerobaculia bacterium]